MSFPTTSPYHDPRVLPGGYRGPCTLVTGGNGFLAYHIIDLLISRGQIIVITARTIEKVLEVIDFFSARYRVPIGFFVIPDPSITTAFSDLFIKYTNLTTVIHTYAPFHYNDEDNSLNFTRLYFEPMVVGTKNLFAAIRRRGLSVKSFVLTSAIEAVIDLAEPVLGGENSEKTWSNVPWDHTAIEEKGLYKAYMSAKAGCEKRAWKSVEYHSQVSQFDLNTIVMPMAIGPHLNPYKVSPFEDNINISSKLVWRIANSRILKEDEEAMKNTLFPCMDVRDLAEIHVLAALENRIKGNRILPFEQEWFCASLVQMVVKDKFPSLVGRLFSIDQMFQMQLAWKTPHILNDTTATLLDPYKSKYRPIRRLIEETLAQFIEQDPFEMEIIRVFYADSPGKSPSYDFDALLNLEDPDFELLLDFPIPELDEAADEMDLDLEIEKLFQM